MVGTVRRSTTARARGVSLLACGALLALAACGSSTGTPTPASTVTERADVVADKGAVPTPEVEPVWPLTGVAGQPDPRPAIAVKIENTSAARPQAGLDQADVVWETIVEFEVSRFVAVFQSQVPGEVGPIRSVRPMDPLIVSPLGGMLVYSGGQPGILALANAAGVQIVSHDAGAPGMYRSKARKAPHNVYGNPAEWWANAEAGRTAPGQQFAFARSAEQASAVTGGTPAGTLDLRLSGQSNPVWAWDAASGTWLRSEGGTPATAASGARLSAVNVVSITAGHPNTEFGAQGGAPVPTYDLVGSGDAVLATGGKTLPVRWQKDAQEQPMRLFLPDGSEATLAPGNTWVELVPAGTGTLTVS